MTFTLWGPVLAERRQGSSGGSLRARSPDSVQVSWPREPGAQDQTGPQVPQDAQMAGARSIDCILQTATAMRSQRQKWGSKSSLSQGLGLASGWPCEGSGALQDRASSLFPGPSNLPTALRLGELQVPREKARICLYLNLHLHGGRTTTHSMDHLLNAPLEKGKATYSSILAWRVPWTV